jgi:hypothetical protein
MTMQDITGLITSFGVLLSAITSALAFIQSRKNAQGIQSVHIATNSLTERLVKSTADESFARGIKAGESSSMNINHRKPE